MKKGILGMILVVFVLMSSMILGSWWFIAKGQKHELFHEHANIVKAKASFDSSKYFLNNSTTFAVEWAAYELGKNGGGFEWDGDDIPTEEQVKNKLKQSINSNLDNYERSLEDENTAINNFRLDSFKAEDRKISVEMLPKLVSKSKKPKVEIYDKFNFTHIMDIRYILLYKEIRDYIKDVSFTERVTCSGTSCGGCPDVEDDCKNDYKNKIDNSLDSLTTGGIKISASRIDGSFDYDYSDSCSSIGECCIGTCCDTCTDEEGNSYTCNCDCCSTPPDMKTTGTMNGKSVKFRVMAEDTNTQILTGDGFKNLKFIVEYKYYF